MITVEHGQIWRSIYDSYVIVGDLGVHKHFDGHYEVLWVHPCDPNGAPYPWSAIPMNPPQPDTGEGFPGRDGVWELVGYINDDGVAVFEAAA